MNRVLPLGTIVKLDVKSNDKYMIIARLLKNAEDGKYYDYCLCQVPIGICANHPLRFIMNEDIKQLLFIGYQDELELAVSVKLAKDKDKLIAMAEELESNSKSS